MREQAKMLGGGGGAYCWNLDMSELLSEAPCLPFLLAALCPAMDDTGLLVPEVAWLPPGIMTLPCPSCRGMSWPMPCPAGTPGPKKELPALSGLPAKPLRRLVSLNPNVASQGIWEPA